MFKQIFLILSVMLFFVLSLIVFLACPVSTLTIEDDLLPDCPVESILFEEDENGFLQSKTSHSHDYGIWWIHHDNQNQSPLDTVETIVKKISGWEGGAFGICFYFNKFNSNCYEVIIDIEKRYKIYKIFGAVRTTIRDWTTSLSLNSGYDVENTIKVARYGDASFDVCFNDATADSFYDNDITEGLSGFVLEIGEEADEEFPCTLVDVRFKQLQPIEMP